MAHKDDRNRGKRNWTEDDTQRDFGSRGDFERDQFDYDEESMRSRGRNDLENYDDSGRGGSHHAGRRPSPLSHRAQQPADDWRPGGMKTPRFGESSLPGGDYSTGEKYPRGREFRNPDYRGEERFGETYRDEAHKGYGEDRGSSFSNYPNQDYGANTMHWDSARSDRDVRASRARMDDRDWNSPPAYRDEGFFGSGAETNRNLIGPHAGKGPQNYRRSDERIHEDVCERLTMHGQIDATNIEVKVSDGEVTLSGSVDSRHAKRLAEDAIEDVPGLRDISNQLRVAPRQGTDREQHVSTHSETDRGSSSKRTTK